MRKKPRAKIENWRLVEYTGGVFVLTGYCREHEGRTDLIGGPVRTSQLKEVNFEKMECETRNTIYEMVGPMRRDSDTTSYPL